MNCENSHSSLSLFPHVCVWSHKRRLFPLRLHIFHTAFIFSPLFTKKPPKLIKSMSLGRNPSIFRTPNWIDLVGAHPTQFPTSPISSYLCFFLNRDHLQQLPVLNRHGKKRRFQHVLQRRSCPPGFSTFCPIHNGISLLQIDSHCGLFFISKRQILIFIYINHFHLSTQRHRYIRLMSKSGIFIWNSAVLWPSLACFAVLSNHVLDLSYFLLCPTAPLILYFFTNFTKNKQSSTIFEEN